MAGISPRPYWLDTVLSNHFLQIATLSQLAVRMHCHTHYLRMTERFCGELRIIGH